MASLMVQVARQHHALEAARRDLASKVTALHREQELVISLHVRSKGMCNWVVPVQTCMHGWRSPGSSLQVDLAEARKEARQKGSRLAKVRGDLEQAHEALAAAGLSVGSGGGGSQGGGAALVEVATLYCLECSCLRLELVASNSMAAAIIWRLHTRWAV